MDTISTQIKKVPTHKGVVVSDAMDKTIVVKVNTLKTHAKYRKQYTSSKNYKVHDEENVHKVGDVVTFQECRPYSKGKRHQVVKQQM